MDPSEPQEPTASVQDEDTDPARLVDALVASGPWPDPALLERILSAGEAVVEPLRTLARTRPRDWPAEVSLQHAAGLLGELRAEVALPELAALAREYLDEVSEDAVASMATLGSEGFEALLKLLQDPAVVGYQRWSVIEMSARIASDPDRQSRLAEVLRGLFASGVEEFKATKAFESELVESSDQARDQQNDVPDGPEFERLESDSDLDEVSGEVPGQFEELAFPDPESEREWEQAENELLPEEALATIASGLCHLADPLSRGMIESAFKEGMIAESILTEETFWSFYEEGRREERPEFSWLESYKGFYEEHRESEEELSRMAPLDFPSRTSYPSFEPAPSRVPAYSPPPPVEPIRHARPRIGRNDPCWCGSGKKYKKCHLGRDSGA